MTPNEMAVQQFVQLVQTGLIIEDLSNNTRRAIGYLAVVQDIDPQLLPLDIGLAARAYVQYVTERNEVPPKGWWLPEEERERLYGRSDRKSSRIRRIGPRNPLHRYFPESADDESDDTVETEV